MGAACFKAAGNGTPEAINESWGGSQRSIGSAKSKAVLSPARSKGSPDRTVQSVKGANKACHDRDVHQGALGVESKFDSRSASSANSSSTPNQPDARPDAGAGVNPHFKSVPKKVPISPRRGFQILSEDAPSLKLDTYTARQRPKPTAISPAVPKLPEDTSASMLSDDEVNSQLGMPSTDAWMPDEASEFAEATAALHHYYASEMPGGDSEMPGAAAIGCKVPAVPCADDRAESRMSDTACEAALDTIDATDAGGSSVEPRLMPHLPLYTAAQQHNHQRQATSIFDSPFLNQSTRNMSHNTSDSDLSSAAKDSARNGGSNSAASSAVAATSKRGSHGPSGLPTISPPNTKSNSPEKVDSRGGRKKSKPKKSPSKVCNSFNFISLETEPQPTHTGCILQCRDTN